VDEWQFGAIGFDGVPHLLLDGAGCDQTVAIQCHSSFNEHSNRVEDVAFARDGKRIASASEDRSVIIWNAATGRKETTLVSHTTRVSGLAFAPAGDWLASVDRDGRAIVWDLAQRQLRLKFSSPRRRDDTHSRSFGAALHTPSRVVGLAIGLSRFIFRLPYYIFHLSLPELRFSGNDK